MRYFGLKIRSPENKYRFLADRRRRIPEDFPIVDHQSEVGLSRQLDVKKYVMLLSNKAVNSRKEDSDQERFVIPLTQCKADTTPHDSLQLR